MGKERGRRGKGEEKETHKSAMLIPARSATPLHRSPSWMRYHRRQLAGVPGNRLVVGFVVSMTSSPAAASGWTVTVVMYVNVCSCVCVCVCVTVMVAIGSALVVSSGESAGAATAATTVAVAVVVTVIVVVVVAVAVAACVQFPVTVMDSIIVVVVVAVAHRVAVKITRQDDGTGDSVDDMQIWHAGHTGHDGSGPSRRVPVGGGGASDGADADVPCPGLHVPNDRLQPALQ